MTTKQGIVGGLMDRALENFWLKLIALISALGFYAFINSAQPLHQKIEVQVRYELPERDAPKALKSDIPRNIYVDVEGPAQSVSELDESTLWITLNLQGMQDETLRLTQDMIQNLPPRVRVTKFSPGHLDIKFEDIVTRDVDVQVARTGEPKRGFEVNSIIVEPQVVQAIGIKSQVDTLQFARAEPFDVTDLEEGRYTRSLKLDEPPQGVEYDHQSVTARVDVTRELAKEVFDAVSVEVVGLPRAKTRPAVVNIRISGPPDVVSKITKELVVPQVDLSKEEIDFSVPGSKNFPVRVDLPDVQIEIIPDKVLVKW